MLNTPLNPIGRVIRCAEREALHACCRDSQAVAISTKSMSTSCSMNARMFPDDIARSGDRVVRVGSAGKMFSLTGWEDRLGNRRSPPHRVIAKAHQFITFTTSPALQLGIAHALEHEIDFTLGLTKSCSRSATCWSRGFQS